MARITRDLLRRRAEHNDGIVRTLREVSLHRQNLEAIDACVQRDCRELRILLLHDNQIGKLGESLSCVALKIFGFFWDVLFSVRAVTDPRGCDRWRLASVCEENLSRLKRLTYLNASLNNITAIENLDGCESLEKLDLTGNFVDVESMEKSMGNLSKNERLRSLF